MKNVSTASTSVATQETTPLSVQTMNFGPISAYSATMSPDQSPPDSPTISRKSTFPIEESSATTRFQFVSRTGTLTPNDEAVTPDDETVTPDDETVTPDNKLVTPDEIHSTMVTKDGYQSFPNVEGGAADGTTDGH